MRENKLCFQKKKKWNANGAHNLNAYVGAILNEATTRRGRLGM